MNKAVRVILSCTLFLTIVLSGCTGTSLSDLQPDYPPEGYQVLEENGSYFLTFDFDVSADKYTHTIFDVYIPKLEPGFPAVYFNSVGDMKDHFIEADFKKDEYIRLYHFFERDADNRIILPDLDNLYDISLPDSLRIEKVFVDGGNAYKFNLIGKNDFSDMGKVTVDYNPLSAFSIEIQGIVDDMQDLDVLTGYEESIFNEFGECWKYTYQKGGAIWYVHENCQKDSDESTEYYHYSVFSVQNDCCVKFDVKGLRSRLSPKEISAFGLVPYEG